MNNESRNTLNYKKDMLLSSPFSVNKLIIFLGMVLMSMSINAMERPNIIMILSDDHGSKDFGFRGGNVDTPVLDRLFHEGRTLNRFYVQPQCTPSRAAFITGRYPVRYGMHYGVVLPHSQWGLPSSEVTLPEVLRDEGYQTAMIGKWHLGHAEESMLPENRGFDYFFGNYNGSLDYFKHEFPGGRGHDLHENRQTVYLDGYITEVYGEKAANVIRSRDPDKPFFLYLAFTAPHDPWQAPEDTIRKYEEQGIERPRATYLAMVEEMDNAIGDVMQAVSDAGIDENTLIIYASDNGGPFAPEITSNGFLRGEKGTTYEGGIHVPAVVRWKGRIPARSSSDELIYVGDFFSTFVHLAGASPERGKALDSYNIINTLVDGAASPRENVIMVTGPESFWNGVITDRWKLVVSVHNERILPDTEHHDVPANHALYDLKNDPYEKHDVSGKYYPIYNYLLRLWEGLYEHRVESDFSLDQSRGDDPDVWGQF